MKKHTVVFILASPRSGSTMLDLVLGAHPMAATVGELVYGRTRHCSMCGPDCEMWARSKELAKEMPLYQAVGEVFEVPVIIDSSKKIRWIQSQLKALESYRIIRLTRDGYDRLYNRKQTKGNISKNSVLRWVRREQRINKFLSNYDHLRVRYEDVCNGDGLQQCCDYIGIDYDPSMREFWKVPHHGISGNKKTYALVRKFHGFDLNSEQDAFYASHGLELKQREHIEFMNDKERLIWGKYGLKMNQTLGYD